MCIVRAWVLIGTPHSYLFCSSNFRIEEVMFIKNLINILLKVWLI